MSNKDDNDIADTDDDSKQIPNVVHRKTLIKRCVEQYKGNKDVYTNPILDLCYFLFYYHSNKSDYNTKDVELDKELTAEEESTTPKPKEENTSSESTPSTEAVSPTTSEIHLFVEQLFANVNIEKTTVKTINCSVATHFGLTKAGIKRRKKQSGQD